MKTEPRSIYLLPGMGADHTLYSAPAWQTLGNVQFLDWPEYRCEKTISEMAARVVDSASIPDGATLIGSSLGGIVACEIARIIELRALVLIGSAEHPSEISGLLTLLHPLARLAPIEFVQTAAGKIPNEVTRMFSRSHAEFIRATCFAIFDWPGLDRSRIIPIRIHGKHDHVIPLPKQVDLVIDGSHNLAWTHSEDCVKFLKARGLV